MESHRVIVITGANRGIGLEFARQLLFTQTPPLQYLLPDSGCSRYTVLALCRTFDQAQWDELSSRVEQFNADNAATPNFVPRSVLPLRCDVLNEQDLLAVKDFIQTSSQIPHCIDYLICNSGIIEQNPGASIASISSFDPDITKIFHTNTIAPIVITNILMPFLNNAAQARAGPDHPTSTPLSFDSTVNPGVKLDSLDQSPPIRQFAQCLYLSSNMGSLSLTNMPLCPTYRASKCALNMYVKCLSIENPTINFMAMSPGWCDTDMGSRGGRTPPQTVQESVAGMLKQMNLYSFAQYSGQHLFSYDDTFVSW